MNDGTKIVLVGLLLVGAVAGFLFFWQGEEARELARNDDPASIEEEPVEVAPRRARTVLAGESSSEAPDVAESEKAGAEADDVESGARAPISFEVEITLEAIDGQPIPEPSGRIVLDLERPSKTDEEIVVAFERGRASFRIPAQSGLLHISKVLCGEDARPTLIRGNREFELAQLETARVTLNCSFFTRVLLEVVDRRSGLPLKDVVVARTRDAFDGGTRPARFEDALLIARGDAPLHVDAIETGTFQYYWVSAPGYAGACLHFAERSEGKRTIALEPGGKLEVNITGDFSGIHDTLKTSLRLRPKETMTDVFISNTESLVSLSFDEPGQVTIEQLVPGDYGLSLESGKSWERGVRIIDEKITIRAGETTRLDLQADLSTLRHELVEVELRFLVPIDGREKELRSCSIRAAMGSTNPWTPRNYKQASLVAGRPGEQRIADLLLAPCEYVARVDGHTFEFVVTADRTEPYTFRIEARPVLELKLLHPGSDKEIWSAHVSWSGAGGSGRGRWDAEKRAYLLAPLEGRIRLSVHSNGHASDVEFDHEFNRLQRTLEVPPGQSFVLILKCGDLVIPHDFSLPLALENADGHEARISGGMSNGHRIERNLREPGRYTLSISRPPAGFRSKGPVTFEVKPGELKEVVYELVEDK